MTSPAAKNIYSKQCSLNFNSNPANPFSLQISSPLVARGAGGRGEALGIKLFLDFGPYLAFIWLYLTVFGPYLTLFGSIGSYLALTVKQKRNKEGTGRKQLVNILTIDKDRDRLQHTGDTYSALA